MLKNTQHLLHFRESLNASYKNIITLLPTLYHIHITNILILPKVTTIFTIFTIT